MKNRFMNLLAACLCVATTGVAATHPKEGHAAFSADFLYLSPTVDDTYFVVENTPAGDTTGKRKNNDFGFFPAFRVGATYAFCECNRELQIYYTRLGAKETTTVSGSTLSAIVGNTSFVSSFDFFSGYATSTLNLLYQRADALFAQQA